MNKEQLAQILYKVFGIRGGDDIKQAGTVALGWRQNWNYLFVAIQKRPLEGINHYGDQVREMLKKISPGAHVQDAREYANDSDYMKSGFGTASAHAEMMVVAAILKMRVIKAQEKLNNKPKYTPKYAEERFTHRRNKEMIPGKLMAEGRQVLIVSNAQTCCFCGNLMEHLGVNYGWLDKGGELITKNHGPNPNTGWWNPLNDCSYGHNAQGWDSHIPGY